MNFCKNMYNSSALTSTKSGDVGGQIGLFIGAGAMSYFEFVDCFALVIYARFFQSFKQPPPAV